MDLNRVYQAPDGRLQPVIAAFKEMVRAFTQEREVRPQLPPGHCWQLYMRA